MSEEFHGMPPVRYVLLAVSDTGAGMDEETLSRAIEPFFTTKSSGKGTGLGLSQVYGFATQSGGDVRIDSRPGEGTIVTLLLPCSSSAQRARREEESAGVEAARSGRILLVEDNEEVGAFAETLLSELGYEVRWAKSAQRALALSRAEGFDAVFSDVVMPGMSGIELADVLGREKPGLPVVLTTGYSDELAESGTGGRPVILKPYRLETLAAALDQALGVNGK
jgi:CheY-like chemotaxis protein